MCVHIPLYDNGNFRFLSYLNSRNETYHYHRFRHRGVLTIFAETLKRLHCIYVYAGIQHKKHVGMCVYKHVPLYDNGNFLCVSLRMHKISLRGVLPSLHRPRISNIVYVPVSCIRNTLACVYIYMYHYI